MKNTLKVKQIFLIPSIGNNQVGIASDHDINLANDLRGIFRKLQFDMVISSDEKNARQTAQIIFEDIASQDEETPKLSLLPSANDGHAVHLYEIIKSKSTFNEEIQDVHFSEIFMSAANIYLCEKANQAMIACKRFTDEMVHESGNIAIIAEPAMLHTLIELLYDEGDPHKDETLIEPGQYFQITYDQMFLDFTEVHKKGVLQKV